MKTLKKLLAVSVVAVAGHASAATFDVSGSWISTATISGVAADIAMTANSGTYDSTTGIGSWNLTADASAITGAVITFDQTFTIDSATGVGTLNADASNCTGTGTAFAVSLTCNGLGANFYGPLDAGGAIVAGQQAWAVLTPVSPADVVFAPTLTATTPAVPVPAAAWLFGSGLLGLAGTARRRRA